MSEQNKPKWRIGRNERERHHTKVIREGQDISAGELYRDGMNLVRAIRELDRTAWSSPKALAVLKRHWDEAPAELKRIKEER